MGKFLIVLCAVALLVIARPTHGGGLGRCVDAVVPSVAFPVATPLPAHHRSVGRRYSAHAIVPGRDVRRDRPQSLATAAACARRR
jgi:hypothetical protein